MAKKDFAELVKEKMSEKVPEKLRWGEWYANHEKYPHILQHFEDNFLDDDIPKECDIKGNLFEEKTGKKQRIGYHKGATSLNSSQVVCISFFKKFFDKDHEEWQTVLLNALRTVEVPIGDVSINNAVFEYVPDRDENTNFDFYIELDDGSHVSHVSMEIKYTEAEFNGLSRDKNKPDKYEKKWEEIYKGRIRDCPYLDNEKCTKDVFYNNYYYQINRNICYAKDGDIVLFITPRANDAHGMCIGRAYIDSFDNPRIMNVYWEDLVEALMKHIAGEPELLDYYGKFKKKYIDILQEI